MKVIVAIEVVQHYQLQKDHSKLRFAQVFRTLYLKFLKWNEKVHNISSAKFLCFPTTVNQAWVGWFACLLPAEIADVMEVFSLLSCVKADFGSPVKFERLLAVGI